MNLRKKEIWSYCGSYYSADFYVAMTNNNFLANVVRVDFLC